MESFLSRQKTHRRVRMRTRGITSLGAKPPCPSVYFLGGRGCPIVSMLSWRVKKVHVAREVKMKLSTALVISLLSSAVVSAITEPNCTVKYGEFMHASVHVLYCIELVLY